MINDLNEKKLNLIEDKAIDKLKYDALDFDVYAEVLADSIVNTPSPFRIGIYGKWGKGKTSLLKFLINETSSSKYNKNIINVFFDSWKINRNDEPLIELLNAIEKTIQINRIKFDENIMISLLDYLNYLKKAIFKINNNTNSTELNTYLMEIYELLKKLEVMLFEEEFLIVVFIDNLDKCNNSYIVNMFESINAFFNLKGVSFVIAADKDLLENRLNTSIYNTSEYLNKTIQLPFFIPSFNGKLNELLETVHLKSNVKTQLEPSIKNVIQSISTLDILSPRLVIRLINKIKVATKIYIKLNPNTKLSGENILSLFSVSSILEELFNEFHNILIKKPSIGKYIIKFLQSETFYKDELLMNSNILNFDKKILIDVLENNFDVLKMIFSTEEGKYWLENKSYRLITYEFLKSNNELMNNIHIDSLPEYKTDFSDNIVKVDNLELNPKEFVKIPNKDYEISKYVVTNEWFNEFITAGGYNQSKYWTDIASNVWLMNNSINSLDAKYDDMVKKEALYFKKKFNTELKKENFNSNLQPIVYITYYEAVAFCRYLTDIDDEYEYKIPSKDEWEYVASGAQKKKIFPWGNTWDKNYCNNATNQLNKTTEIGRFPQGDSSFGVSDMVGNVWVWTSTLDNNDYNYLKGGSWSFSDPSYFTISNSKMTFYNNPSYQHYDIGFLCIRKRKS